MTEAVGSRELWAAVDALTNPTKVRVVRAADADALAEFDERIPDLDEGKGGRCSVGQRRLAQASQAAASTGWATVPSLWEQATIALTGGEQGGSGSKPLRERSPADLDLMEIRALIRDTTRHELEQLGHPTARTDAGDPVPFMAEEIRELARLVTGRSMDDLWWWEYRFAQWGRLLESYLHLAEHRAKPVRLRNTACPNCDVKQVILPDEDTDDANVVPALVIDFSPDGYVRAAECLHCGAAWFRGAQLEELAQQVSAQSERIGA